MDRLAHPYFTHSAFYMDNDLIVEAVGTEENPQNEIQIASLSKSDWFNEDVNTFIIIRPKNYGSSLALIKMDLEEIANDPEYTFGLPGKEQKKLTCADLILNQLQDKNIVEILNTNKIVTPDYLFYTLTSNPNFEVVGYNN
jgi:hypothetical protein